VRVPAPSASALSESPYQVDLELKVEKDRTYMRLGVALLTIFGLLASGCGAASTRGNVATSTVRTVQSPPSTSATPPTPPSAPKLGSPVNQQTWQVKTGDGYSGTMAVRIYPLVHTDRLPQLPYSNRHAFVACHPDPQSAAAVPITFSVRYTTKGFRSDVLVGIGEDDSDGPPLEGDIQLGDGTTACTKGLTVPPGLFQEQWTDVAPGSTLTGDFYVILDNYYSPAKPGGDSQQLANSCVDGGGITFASASGTEHVSPENPLRISLAGRRANGDC